MRCIPAVGSGYDVAADSRRSARPPMTERTAVGQPRPNGQITINVADAIVFIRALPLGMRELALKQLPAPANGPVRIMRNHAHRRPGRGHVSPSSPNFILQ